MNGPLNKISADQVNERTQWIMTLNSNESISTTKTIRVSLSESNFYF